VGVDDFLHDSEDLDQSFTTACLRTNGLVHVIHDYRECFRLTLCHCDKIVELQ